MLAHRLRHRITLQRLGEPERDDKNRIIPGTGGWQVATLADGTRLENMPAEVLTGPGREWVGSAAPQAEASARINLRWFPVDRREIMSWRLLWDGSVYSITSAETDITARREWRLRCMDGPTEGQ